MLYLYDKAICDDLKRSLDPSGGASSVIKVIDPEASIGIAAQIQNDNPTFPMVVLKRNPFSIDQTRCNFTWMHRGVQAVIDTETNNIYHEKIIPINLTYSMTVLTTNTADMDEMVRELTFKYLQMYYLTITLPYECDRKIRFGIVSERAENFEQSSGSFEYISGGKLYQTIIPLRCEGCVQVSYTPVKLKRMAIDPNIQIK